MDVYKPARVIDSVLVIIWKQHRRPYWFMLYEEWNQI